MIIKKFRLILFFYLTTFVSLSVIAQDSVHLQSSLSVIRKQLTIRYLKPSAIVAPGAFIMYGGLRPVIQGISKSDTRIMSEVQQRFPDFHSNLSDYLMWVPSASVFALDALKIKTSHSFKDHLLIEGVSILITGGIGYGMRIITGNIKGYGTDKTQFPSGHAANAFRGAEILHQELKQKHPLLSYSGYFAATAVGVLRIYGKEHYLSQVIAGAGLGILSTKLTYWIFQKIKKSE